MQEWLTDRGTSTSASHKSPPAVSTLAWLAEYSFSARYKKRTHQDKNSQLRDIKKKKPDPTHQERDTSWIHQGVIVVCTAGVSLSAIPKWVILSAMLQKGVTSLETLTSPRHLRSGPCACLRPETSSLCTSGRRPPRYAPRGRPNVSSLHSQPRIQRYIIACGRLEASSLHSSPALHLQPTLLGKAQQHTQTNLGNCDAIHTTPNCMTTTIINIVICVVLWLSLWTILKQPTLCSLQTPHSSQKRVYIAYYNKMSFQLDLHNSIIFYYFIPTFVHWKFFECQFCFTIHLNFVRDQ
jgi:hypothetical protein